MESKDNKYLKWYWNICDRAKYRILESNIYGEWHHIYPKSIYGKNDNIVNLTAKEHYIAHLVLWWGLRSKYGTKDERTIKMGHAFTMMNSISLDNKGRYKVKNANEYIFLRIASKEQSNICSENRKRNIRKKIAKTVYQYKNKDLLKVYDTITDASLESGANIDGIVACCKNRNLTAGGFIWSYKELSENELNKRLLDIDHKSDYKCKKVGQFDKNRKLIKKYNSLKNAADCNNININTICGCCRGRLKFAGGFIWKYL